MAGEGDSLPTGMLPKRICMVVEEAVLLLSCRVLLRTQLSSYRKSTRQLLRYKGRDEDMDVMQSAFSAATNPHLHYHKERSYCHSS